jgi:hypothetical protein
MNPEDIDFTPDCRGECDHCGQDNLPLMTDWDEPGEFQYCEECWTAPETIHECSP